MGVAVPLRAGKLLASYVRHDDRTAAGKDASQWGLGYNYPLSKRTDFYSAYARINNRHGAAYTVGNATDKGSGNSAFDLGVRHSF
jgi:predicted porin